MPTRPGRVLATTTLSVSGMAVLLVVWTGDIAPGEGGANAKETGVLH
jgi:hypothetical protein